MSDKKSVGFGSLVFNSTDAFSESADQKAKQGYSVHIRNQQRNGRKSITTIAGLADDLDLKKILKYMRKMFNTNGTILKDDEVGEVVQLQGDVRGLCFDFLTKYNICQKETIKVHGF